MSAFISAIAVLENGRVLDTKKKKSLTFDAHLFLPNSTEGCLASLHYYNVENYSFEDVGAYFIIANVAKVEQGAAGVTSEDLNDYMLVGDIVSLTPAGDGIDPKKRPFVHIAGSVDNIDEREATFDLAPEQYVTALKDQKGLRPNFPVRVFIKDSPRWKGPNGEDKRPKPKPGTYVAVGAFLNAVTRDQSTGKVLRFDVELHQVTYLGRAPLLPSNENSDATTPMKGKGRKFSYNSPSPLPAKRRRIEAENSSLSLASETSK